MTPPSDCTERLVAHCQQCRCTSPAALVAATLVECVRAGADIHARLPFTFAERWTTALHYVLEYGSAECAEALLSTSAAIDFMAANSEGMPALYCVVRIAHPCTASSVLQCVVARLQQPPLGDTVDFHAVADIQGKGKYNFFSFAATHKRLFLIWNHVEVLPQICNRPDRILVTVPVPLEDLLGLHKRCDRFDFLAGGECCAEATRRLKALCAASNDPDATAVLGCVNDFADVCACWPGTREPILSRMLRECSVGCAMACLQSYTLELAVRHVVCLSQRDDTDDIRELMHAIARRVECRYALIPWREWEIVLQYSWRYGVLSAVWPILCQTRCGLEPGSRGRMSVVLRGGGWAYDWRTMAEWENLGLLEMDVDGGSFCEESEDTARLVRLLSWRVVNRSAVLEAIRRGGNVLHFRGPDGYRLLYKLVAAGDEVALAEVLETLQDPIDFTARDMDDKNILDAICSVEDRRVVLRLFSIVVQRLQQHPELDCVDVADARGHENNLVSCAVRCGCLLLFWSTLKALPQLSNQQGRIPISVRVSPMVFRQLPLEDRRDRLDFLEGVGCCPEATARLVALFAVSRDPDVAAVLHCVEDCADVCVHWPGTSEPIIGRVLRECSVRCALACLQSCTLRLNANRIRPLSQRHDMDEIRELMRAIAQRVECRYSLMPWREWEDVVQCCWRSGVLSAVWPEVQRVPCILKFCGGENKPIHLNGGGWAYDWENLCSLGNDYYFEVESGGEGGGGNQFCQDGDAAAGLLRLLRAKYWDMGAVMNCLRVGVSVHYVDDEGETVLHHVVKSGRRAAMVSSHIQRLDMVDLTLPGKNGATVLHTLCEVKEESIALEMLQVFVERLRTHPLDRVDLKVCDRTGKNVLSCAAMNQRLGVFWNLIQWLPQIHEQQGNGRIPITVRVSLEDFRQLPLEDRRDRFDFLAGVECCAEATGRLKALCAASNDPDATAVLGCVNDFADVCACWPGTNEPITSRMLRECSVGCAMACLQSYTLCGDVYLFLPLSQRVAVEEIQQLLRVIISTRVQRVFCEARFQVWEWELLIGDCWRYGVLSAVWPELRGVACVAERLRKPCPIRLFGRGWMFDWEALCARGEDRLFHLDMGESMIRRNNKETAELHRLCGHVAIEKRDFVQCLQRGGCVDYENESGKGTLLHQLVKRGMLELLSGAVQAVERIDFTARDTEKNTVFHQLCKTTDFNIAMKMLGLFVERVKRQLSDIVDFSAKNECGLDFLSLAAHHKRLAAFFPLVRDMPYYADNTNGIELVRVVVSNRDWCQLSAEDQQCFKNIMIRRD